jgi:hypothetical protein
LRRLVPRWQHHSGSPGCAELPEFIENRTRAADQPASPCYAGRARRMGCRELLVVQLIRVKPVWNEIAARNIDTDSGEAWIVDRF